MKTVLQLLGMGCFILVIIISIDFAGFEAHRIANKKVLITSLPMLYGAAAGLGMVGSLLMSAKMWKAALPAGLVTSLVMVAFTLFYLSFRASFWNYEILVIALVGMIPYIIIFGYLSEKLYGVVAFSEEQNAPENTIN